MRANNTMGRVRMGARIEPAKLDLLRDRARRLQKPLGHLLDEYAERRFALSDDSGRVG